MSAINRLQGFQRLERTERVMTKPDAEELLLEALAMADERGISGDKLIKLARARVKELNGGGR